MNRSELRPRESGEIPLIVIHDPEEFLEQLEESIKETEQHFLHLTHHDDCFRCLFKRSFQ